VAAKTRAAARTYPNRRGDYAQIYAPGFDWREYLRRYDPRLMETSEGRRAIGRLDPLAFALIYLRDWLKGDDGEISFAKFHADSYEWALSWIGNQLPMSNRRAWVAPRGSAKSTMHFRIIPLWALCYLHKDYVAIFSRTDDHANEHMLAIQRVRLESPLLRLDFPDFVAPRMLGDKRAKAQHDTLDAYLAKNGAVLTAKGMNSSVLGSSIDGRRANVIVLDDVENSEANYTPYQAEQVKKTITGAIAFYNVNAIWSWVGTTTMYDGLVHQLVKTTDSVAPELRNGDETRWVHEQNVTVRHYRPLVEQPDGSRVSMWPAKWSTEFLKSIEHTRVYRMELDNLPSLADQGMWQEDDFTYVDDASAENARCALFVDPAVTATETSDYTGLAVTQYPFPTAEETKRGLPGHVEVLHVERIKLIGQRRRDHVMRLLTRYPQIKRICVEDNQGGAMWLEEFAGLGVTVELIHAVEAKEVRAAHALDKYQARPTQVVHVGKHSQVEATMQAFPAVVHDDDVDAVVYGVLYWLSPAEVRKKGVGVSRGPHVASTQSYVRR
jgi:phage terminase large subunit-like protein